MVSKNDIDHYRSIYGFIDIYRSFTQKILPSFTSMVRWSLSWEDGFNGWDIQWCRILEWSVEVEAESHAMMKTYEDFSTAAVRLVAYCDERIAMAIYEAVFFHESTAAYRDTLPAMESINRYRQTFFKWCSWFWIGYVEVPKIGVPQNQVIRPFWYRNKRWWLGKPPGLKNPRFCFNSPICKSTRSSIVETIICSYDLNLWPHNTSHIGLHVAWASPNLLQQWAMSKGRYLWPGGCLVLSTRNMPTLS